MPPPPTSRTEPPIPMPAAAKPLPPKPEAPAEAAPAAASAKASGSRGGGFSAWLPAIAALVVAPAATWVTIEFVMLPRLEKKIAGHAPEIAAQAHAAADAAGTKGKATASYEFQNIVVNVAGTMGTRYLRVSLLVKGSDPQLKAVFEGSKPELLDVTNTVLSSLTLADIEEPGSRNIIREKLVNAYNESLKRRVAEQVLLTDFVVQ